MGLRSYWKELLAVLLLIVIIGIEPLYRQPGYDYSLEFILSWQQKGNETRKRFFKFISLFATNGVIAALFLAIYSFFSRRLLIKSILVIYICQNIITLFKVFYHDPRPYLSSDEIEAMNCSSGYGNPSGHCLFTTGFYGSMWVLLFPNNTEKEPLLIPHKVTRLFIQWVSFVLVVSLIVLTFFARLYLGAHGLNQTIYGTLLGLWVVYTFGVVIPRYVDYHYDHFITKGQLINPINVAFTVVVIIFAILQLLNVILYFSLRNHNDFMNPEWRTRLDLKCPNFKTTPFQDSFKGGLHSSLYVFMYFSQIFAARMFPIAFNYWRSNIGATKFTLRTLNLVIILGLCYLPYFLTRNSSFGLKICLGVLVSNILIMAFGVPLVDWSTERLSLINTGTSKERASTDETYGVV